MGSPSFSSWKFSLVGILPFWAPLLPPELQIHMFYCLPDLSTWMSSGHCEYNIPYTEFCSSLESKLFLHRIFSFLMNNTPSAPLLRSEIWKVILDFFLSLVPIPNPPIIKVYQFNLQTRSRWSIFFCPSVMSCCPSVLSVSWSPLLGGGMSPGFFNNPLPGFLTHPSPHYQSEKL